MTPRTVASVASFLAWAVVAYCLLRLGEFVATGMSLDSLTINAFLFLTGLGVLLRLLSPAPSLHRHRMRW